MTNSGYLMTNHYQQKAHGFNECAQMSVCSDQIVYGENGYGGHNSDDALNAGGANVWINVLPESTVGAVDVVDGYAHMSFQGVDWYLVRRDNNAGDGWHPANDNLAGTATYGALSTDNLGHDSMS